VRVQCVHETYLGTYHDVRVDIFNNEVADILDCGIATRFIQCPDFGRRMISRRTAVRRNQSWIPKIDVVRVARTKVVSPSAIYLLCMLRTRPSRRQQGTMPRNDHLEHMGR
jgi:hypothetical protein